jgi:hypothetical protein
MLTHSRLETFERGDQGLGNVATSVRAESAPSIRETTGELVIEHRSLLRRTETDMSIHSDNSSKATRAAFTNS